MRSVAADVEGAAAFCQSHVGNAEVFREGGHGFGPDELVERLFGISCLTLRVAQGRPCGRSSPLRGVVTGEGERVRPDGFSDEIRNLVGPAERRGRDAWPARSEVGCEASSGGASGFWSIGIPVLLFSGVQCQETIENATRIGYHAALRWNRGR
jgi:hypothetical protein